MCYNVLHCVAVCCICYATQICLKSWFIKTFKFHKAFHLQLKVSGIPISKNILLYIHDAGSPKGAPRRACPEAQEGRAWLPVELVALSRVCECAVLLWISTATRCDTLRHTATHCNTLQHTATQNAWRDSLSVTPKGRGYIQSETFLITWRHHTLCEHFVYKVANQKSCNLDDKVFLKLVKMRFSSRSSWKQAPTTRKVLQREGTCFRDCW